MARFEASDSVAVVQTRAYSAIVAGLVERFFAYYEKCGVFTQPYMDTARFAKLILM